MELLLLFAFIVLIIGLIAVADRWHRRRATRDAIRFARRYMDERYKP